MYGYIYMITNKVNGKIYIGKHQYIGPGLDPNYFASGKIINEAVNKYGRENFDVAMLSTADTLDELNAKEAAYIKEYNSQDLSIGYNLTCGGDGGNTVVGKIKITNGFITKITGTQSYKTTNGDNAIKLGSKSKSSC